MHTLRMLALGLAAASMAMARNRGGLPVSPAALTAAERILAKAPRYSAKQPYSRTIPHVYLTYDKEGHVEKGIALRAFQTYALVAAMVVVEKKDGNFVITEATIPDISLIKDPKQQEEVLNAIKKIKGQVVAGTTGDYRRVDAVTGATRYRKRIFLYYNLLASTLVKEMMADPAWPRKTPGEPRPKP